MAEMQRNPIGGVKELVVLVGILLTVVAGAIGTYWVHSQGVEAAKHDHGEGDGGRQGPSPRTSAQHFPASEGVLNVHDRRARATIKKTSVMRPRAATPTTESGSALEQPSRLAKSIMKVPSGRRL